MLYPSTVEGFGLVPFEAAGHGVPTLATRRGSLDEVLPAGIPTLDGFDVAAAADAAWHLLHDVVAAKELVEALQTHGESYTWDATAARLVDLFADALRRPRGRVLVVEGEGRNPLAVAPRTPRQRLPASDLGMVLERVVDAVITRPRLKNGLSPDGTRRQQTARRGHRPGPATAGVTPATGVHATGRRHHRWSPSGQIRVSSCSHTGRVMLRHRQPIRLSVVTTREEHASHGST